MVAIQAKFYTNKVGKSEINSFVAELGKSYYQRGLMDAGTQSFPLKFSDGSYNVQSFRNMTEEETFYYVFALLQSGEFQQKYRNDLQKDLPNIPMAKEREKYIEIGRKLADLHLNYEDQPIWEGVEVEISKPNYRVKKMKHPKKGILDTIIFNDSITIKNIPEKAYEYIVNGRPAIEWIIDQYGSVAKFSDKSILV